MSDPAARAAAEAVSNPLVLMAAWRRVDQWYRAGNLAPEPELGLWHLHPEGRIRSLSEKLAGGEWRPSAWMQLPYPKKGARLRHFVWPTVTDQVAFMAHMVLLGPFLDSAIHPFAFGNRWDRPVWWDRRGAKPKWRLLPYSFNTARTYLPYARDHGMFRRVAHWTAASMTGSRVQAEDYGGKVQIPDDYDNDHLPPWTNSDWWCGAGAEDQAASWVALDLALAYPSVHLDALRKALQTMLGEAKAGYDSKRLQGYPGPVLEHLEDSETRQHIGAFLMDALDRVEVNDGTIAPGTWKPPHALANLPGDNGKDIGIPTGLAVSGVLLNVALHSMDKGVEEYLQKQTGERRGAILRFADDMYLLSLSESGLFALIDAVWHALCGDPGAVLAQPRSKSNLFLNLQKLRPDAIRRVVLEYLQTQGWSECEKCSEIVPPGAADYADEKKNLSHWWIEAKSQSESGPLGEAVQRARLGKNDIGPFVTTLVERLSEIGRDTLADRFGHGARTRLERLHELARFDIDDEQVRPDTRRAFAVNRLVRTWLPQDEERARSALADIRNSIGHVLKITPWKFSLWRSVVRAAARRTSSSEDDGDKEAASWLSDQLRNVAHDGKRPQCWLNHWPEEIKRPHEPDASWKALYLSYHRAAFWQALRDVLQELWRHQDRMDCPTVWDSGPPPEWWTVRAVPEGRHGSVAQFLGGVDRWARVLYPDGHDAELTRWPWETDQFVGAVLAAHRRHDLARTWMRTEPPDDQLTVPAGLFGFAPSETADLLRQAGRVREYSRREQCLNASALAHVRFGGWDHRLAGLLFPADGQPRIAANENDPAYLVAAGVALDCSESIGVTLLKPLVPPPAERARRFREDPTSFWEYRRAHRILMGQEVEAP